MNEKPVAYIYTMHMELKQTDRVLSFNTHSPFGKPGRDHSASYKITCEPLYLATPERAELPEDKNWGVIGFDRIIANWSDIERTFPQEVMDVRAALQSTPVSDEQCIETKEALEVSPTDKKSKIKKWIENWEYELEQMDYDCFIRSALSSDTVPRAVADKLVDVAKTLALACGAMGLEGPFLDEMVDEIRKYEQKASE